MPGYESFAKYYADLDAVMVTFYSTTDRDLDQVEPCGESSTHASHGSLGEGSAPRRIG